MTLLAGTYINSDTLSLSLLRYLFSAKRTYIVFLNPLYQAVLVKHVLATTIELSYHFIWLVLEVLQAYRTLGVFSVAILFVFTRFTIDEFCYTRYFADVLEFGDGAI